MRTLAVSAGTGALSVPIPIDRDTTLVGFGSAKTCLLTYDQSEVIADWTGPTVTALKNTWIVGSQSGGSLFTTPKITLYSGEVVYLVSSGGISAILYFED